jgi:dUTP pyrophosphatase
MKTIRMARLRPGAVLPSRKHPQDAGLDLFAAEESLLPPHGSVIVPSGITVEIPDGFVGLVKPKGRSDHLIGAGVVDAGYQGEILVKLVNPSERQLRIHRGDAIAQLLIVPIETPEVEEVSPDEIHKQASTRGATGGIVDLHKNT